MQIQTLLLIILAAAVSIGVVLFQYYKPAKNNSRPYLALMILRFLAIFGILLLLINPKFVREQYTLQKSNLLLLVDNTSSIREAGMTEEVNRIVADISTNNSVIDKK